MHYRTAAKWPDGAVCYYCYQKAKRTKGVCACGHEGILPGVVGDLPACRRCSGVRLNVDCRACGAEDELYTGSRCWRCTLAADVDAALSNPQTGSVDDRLAPLADALKSMDRANSGVTWIRQKHVVEFLHALARAEEISHESLDELPHPRTREYVRGLLVEHGVLPRRDVLLIRFEQWSSEAINRVVDPSSRMAIRQYITWNHQRRLRSRGDVARGSFLRSKQSVTVAIDLVNWLSSQGVALADITQEDLDVWQSTGASTRAMAEGFVRWAVLAGLVRPGLKVQPHRRGTSTRLSAGEQGDVVERVVQSHELGCRDRAAAILIIVFGQQMERVAGLTWDDVTVNPEAVTVRLGGLDIALPDPLDEPRRELASGAGRGQTAAHPRSNWVFPGYSPGRPIDAAQLRLRLRTVFSTRAARLGTLTELSKSTPVAIIAEALGYHPSTIERHAVDSAASYARYVATG